MEFPGHPIFQDPVFQTPEYSTFELRHRGALAMAVEHDPHTIAIQKATHAEALGSLKGLITTRLSRR
jgi:hypothetical protein